MIEAVIAWFVRDRRPWRHWLFEARRRYGLSVFNYIVTCNHVHLMVATDDKETVPIKTQEHLIECLVYVDLNMVRAGVVNHPRDWPHAGFHEIQRLRQRYVVIDHERLVAATGERSYSALRRHHRQWVNDKLCSGSLGRDERWTHVEPGGVLNRRR